MKEQGKPLIQVIFLSVLWISIVVTLIGGLFYLSQHGMERLNYQTYQQSPNSSSLKEIWQNTKHAASSGIIMTGILILLLSQVLRVALIAWYYFNLREFKFVGFSLFLVAILVYSLFWKI